MSTRLDALIRDIESHCGPLQTSVERALRAVPRDGFVPDVARIAPRGSPAYVIDKAADPEG
ncbi:hypothetical protein AB0L53_09155 [Nonomuraea sp. NPDC052129]|uniref:hypothetical protein n=1 Tax=Nonomuraea sp. NPDC052129 TaxID=3154651 RepID=UPI00341D379A